jgi:hypothetical protein
LEILSAFINNDGEFWPIRGNKFFGGIQLEITQIQSVDIRPEKQANWGSILRQRCLF